MNTLILGVGNILLSDEAVGVHVANQLDRGYIFPEGVDLLDGGTAGMELLEYIAGRDHVIFIDAVLTGDAPGTVVTLKDDEVPALFNNKVSPHQLGLSDLLGALKLTEESPRNIFLVGVVPESVEPGLKVSKTVAESIPTMIQCVLDYLDEMGINVKPSEDTVLI